VSFSFTSTGGHNRTQAATQLDFDGDAVSLSKRYRGKPSPSMTIEPRARSRPIWTDSGQ
jgi:hypothetical protein